MVIINVLSFYGVNFTFICILIFMMWTIRKRDDRTLIRAECGVIVGLQLLFNMFQAILNASNEAYGCMAHI